MKVTSVIAFAVLALTAGVSAKVNKTYDDFPRVRVLPSSNAVSFTDTTIVE